MDVQSALCSHEHSIAFIIPNYTIAIPGARSLLGVRASDGAVSRCSGVEGGPPGANEDWVGVFVLENPETAWLGRTGVLKPDPIGPMMGEATVWYGIV